jgi:hypothetical protein
MTGGRVFYVGKTRRRLTMIPDFDLIDYAASENGPVGVPYVAYNRRTPSRWGKVASGTIQALRGA